MVQEIEQLTIEGGHELILVNDGSRDATAGICRELLRDARIPIIFINHARNFGEHNAVLTGYRHARGAYVVNLDDDGQNPPAEAVRLWQQAKREGLDVVYGHYAHKAHSAWRNLGSWLTNRMTDWVLDKPRGFYLSSFRCVSAFVAKEVTAHDGPYPYIDGLILQVTQNVGSLAVQHADRVAGESGYTLRRLVRLWSSTLAVGYLAGVADGCGWFIRIGLGFLLVENRAGARLRLGVFDGGALNFFRDPVGDARADRRIFRPNVSDD